MKWELVVVSNNPSENSTYRMKVPEGWLYRYGSQLVFVPDGFVGQPNFEPASHG